MELTPDIQLVLAQSPRVFGLKTAPEVIWTSYASDLIQQSGTGVVDAHYLSGLGELHAIGNPQYDNTYISGFGGPGGRPFTVTSSSPVAPVAITLPEIGKSCIAFESNLASATFDIIDVAAVTTTKLNHNQILLRRGIDKTNAQKTTIELASGDTTNYRIVMDIVKGISLDYYDGNQWNIGVDRVQEIKNLNRYMRQNFDEIRLSIIPDTSRQIMLIMIGDDDFYLRHSPPRPKNGVAGSTTSLPTKERYRIYGNAGWCQIAVYPFAYSNPIIVNKSGKQIPASANINNAKVLSNGSGRDHQEVSTTLSNVSVDSNNKASYTATISTTDPTIPPTGSEITFYIQPEWIFDSPYRDPGPIGVVGIMEYESFDEATRLLTRSADVLCDNMPTNLSGTYGDFAAQLTVGNGSTSAVTLTGMTNGKWSFEGGPGERTASIKLVDNTYKMRVPILQEVNFDAWALPDAVHTVLSLGEISPLYRQNIPVYKGVGRVHAYENCPFPTLPQGTGNNPKMNFLPDARAIDILMELAQDGRPDPLTGKVSPYYTGTDVYGQWFFLPYDPSLLPVTAYYTDASNGGQYGIQHISIVNDIGDIRTSLDFQGQDPFTGELLYLHYDLSANRNILGQNFGWFMRESRFASENYLNSIARSAAVLASIPTETVILTLPYDPTVHCAAKIGISESSTLKGSGLYVVIKKTAAVVVGQESQCSMVLTCRGVASLGVY